MHSHTASARNAHPRLAWLLAQALPLLLTLACLSPAHAARLALVIGNKDYTVGTLKNPVNDADDMAQALGGPGGLGFAVTLVKNLKRDDIGRTVEGFASRIRPGDDVVVFYAGHGLQVKGINYLPAVDARIAVESDVALNSLNLNELLLRLDESKAGVRLLLVDACRDNPYSRGFRSNNRGLARVEGAPSGTLMHFATRPGGVADDGPGRNGLYTSELLKHLRTPGLPVESVLKRVASGVRTASAALGGSQQPWTEGALDGEFYFVPGGAPATGASNQTNTQSPAVAAAVVDPLPVRSVQIINPLKLQSTPSVESAPLRAAGLTAAYAQFVVERLHESSGSWPSGIKSTAARWANGDRNLNLMKLYKAFLVVDLGQEVIVRITAKDNQSMPADLRPQEDFFVQFGKDGVRY